MSETPASQSPGAGNPARNEPDDASALSAFFHSFSDRGGRTELGPFSVLLVAILAYVAVLPFLPGSEEEGLLFRGAWSLLIFAGLLATARSRRVLVVGLTLAAISIALQWSEGYVDVPGIEIANNLSSSLFLAFTTAVVLHVILAREQITLDLILGAVNVFLLIALLFAQLHVATELAHPGAYRLGDQSLSEARLEEETDLQQVLLYFSLTTLTTLGYGDIRPVLHGARMLSTLEAVIGQLFVAILIAYMVSMRANQRQRQPLPEEEPHRE